MSRLKVMELEDNKDNIDINNIKITQLAFKYNLSLIIKKA